MTSAGNPGPGVRSHWLAPDAERPNVGTSAESYQRRSTDLLDTVRSSLGPDRWAEFVQPFLFEYPRPQAWINVHALVAVGELDLDDSARRELAELLEQAGVHDVDQESRAMRIALESRRE